MQHLALCRFPDKGHRKPGDPPALHAAGQEIAEIVGIDGVVQMPVPVGFRPAHPAFSRRGHPLGQPPLGRVGAAALPLRLGHQPEPVEGVGPQQPMGAHVHQRKGRDALHQLVFVGVHEFVAAVKLGALIPPVPGADLHRLAEHRHPVHHAVGPGEQEGQPLPGQRPVIQPALAQVQLPYLLLQLEDARRAQPHVRPGVVGGDGHRPGIVPGIFTHAVGCSFPGFRPGGRRAPRAPAYR